MFFSHRQRLLAAYIVVGLLLVGSSTGCVERVLQTATDDTARGTGGETGQGGANAALISCDEPLTSEEISWEGVPGAEGLIEESPFSGGDYSANLGPGLYVTARDAHRIYFNGRLVAVSEGSRKATFVPMSLVPGDNVIAIAVAAQSGVAAALAQLTELERDYGSDGSWRVSSAPEEDWMAIDFDDSSWAPATELGDRGEVPGCDPGTDFPNGAPARWIGASVGDEGPIVLRKRIRVAPFGFGQAATGGEGSQPLIVTSWEELEAAVDSVVAQVILLPEGTYDFRAMDSDQEVCPSDCPTDPTRIRYQVLVGGDTCPVPTVIQTRNERILALGSNKTIVGLGRGASIRGATLDFQGSENVIVRNVAIFDVNPHLLEAGDAFSLEQPSRVWIDHATTKWVSDGFTDLREGTRDVTLSYMHYDGDNDALCGGKHAWTSEYTNSTVTLHHSRFDNVSGRAPLVTSVDSRAHILNNVYSNISAWAVGSRCQAQVLLEGNLFENVEAATWRSTCDSAEDLGLISAAAGGNLYRDDSNVHLGGALVEPNDTVFEPPYEYVVEPANQSWPVVVSRAGTGGPWALPLSRD